MNNLDLDCCRTKDYGRESEMRKWILSVIIFLVLTIAVGQAFYNVPRADATANVWSSSQTVTIGKKNFSVKAVYINLKSPWIRIKPALGGGYVGGTEELSALARRHGALAAINGTFFNAYSDMQPQGNIQIDGSFLHLSNVGSTVGFGENNEVRFAPLRTYITGTTDNNDDFLHNWYAWGINHVLTDPSAIEIFTPRKGKTTGMKTGTSVVVKNGVVDSVVTGEAPIPSNGYVINFGSNPNVSRYVERFTPGTPVNYSLSFRDLAGNAVDWSRIKHSVGAGPILLSAGRVVVNPRAEGFTDPKILTNSGARSAIGKTAGNVLMLVTVNRATVGELAQVMQKLGAVEAMNLDGGASSGLYFKGSYLTKPGRKISNAILIFEQQPEIKVIISGQTRSFPVKPYIAGGRTLVPLRGVFESLGASVEWDAGTRTVTARKGDITVKLKIGNKAAAINEKTVTIDQAPVIKNGYTFVPLRFVSEALGATVNWDPVGYKVIITQ